MPLNLRQLDYDRAREVIHREVDDFLTQALARQQPSLVRQVVEYVIQGGGHRWRPLAAVASGLIFHPQPLELVMPGACGIELAHAASLILDDLPSMDDARLRRGRPCPHLVFERWAVDLAPVFMITLAYQLSLGNEKVAADQRVASALALSTAGLAMVIGQAVDVDSPEKENNPQILASCYRDKCAALYAAATLTGALSVGAGRRDAEKLFHCGLNLGLAYQFLDDLADVTADDRQTGKTTGRDAGKVTAVDLYGLTGARAKVDEYRQAALADIKDYGEEARLLREVIGSASWE